MDKNMTQLTELTTIVVEHHPLVERLWALLNETRKQLQNLQDLKKPNESSVTTRRTESPVSTRRTESPVNTTPRPTELAIKNSTNSTSNSTTGFPFIPTTEPQMDTTARQLIHLWTANNKTNRELQELKEQILTLTLVPGPSGPRGYNGSNGLPGPQGHPGHQGVQGPQGGPGPQGIMGSRGNNGSQGQEGPVGVTGPRGPTGPDGASGLRGPQGTQGTQGLVGPRGHRGPPGAGNFSLCVYKTVQSTSVSSGPNADVNAVILEPAGKRIIGTVCSTNCAREYILDIGLHPTLGNRFFRCKCRGQASQFTCSTWRMFCFLHYWECPLTS